MITKVKFWNYGKGKDKITSEWSDMRAFQKWIYEEVNQTKGRFTFSFEKGGTMMMDIQTKDHKTLVDAVNHVFTMIEMYS